MPPSEQRIQHRTGSIPAWAGEPRSTWALHAVDLKYGLSPRGRGNHHSVTCTWSGSVVGLSPRGRGNPIEGCTKALFCRSIPAWAGEPDRRLHQGIVLPVYPRVGGGTASSLGIPAVVWGLSPRGRGNRQRAGAQAGQLRSIPAWAGEPTKPWAKNKAPGVYPRVGGGTNVSLWSSSRTSGLSPRGRGNLWWWSCLSIPMGSIPAWAGEPILTAA